MLQKPFLKLTEEIRMERQTPNPIIGGTRHFLKRRLLVVWVCLLVAGLWLLAHVALTNAAPLLAPDATVSLSPSTQVVDLGEHFTVDVMIDEYADLGGYEFDLQFDSSVVQGEKAEDGGLLESSGRTLLEIEPPLLSIDNGSEPGTLSYAELSHGDNPGPTGTNGKLATVQLKATDLHSSTLELDSIQIVDTQGTAQALLPPVGGTVQVNTVVNGKVRELCTPREWRRQNMDPDERKDPPGPGTNDCRDTDQAQTGHYAFKITGSPTEKKMLLQTRKISGEAGDTFKLSGWSYVTSDTALGTEPYKLSAVVTYRGGSKKGFAVDFDPGVWDTWQYREVEFSMAQPYWKLQVYAKFFEKPETATAWFDDIQLIRQGDNTEVTVNSSFEEWCTPREWRRQNMDPDERKDPPGPGTNDCRDTDQAQTGHYAFKITGSPTEKKMLLQTRKISGEAGDTFKLSGWSYVTSDTALGTEPYKLSAVVTYRGGSKKGFAVDFDPGVWDTWQYREVEFSMAQPYWKLQVYAKFFEKPETATAWFDDIQLTRQLP